MSSASTLTNLLRSSGGGLGRIILLRLQQDYFSCSQKRQFNTSQASADIYTHMQAPRMLNKMMKKQERILKSAKSKQQGSSNKPKKLTFGDSAKMKSFNATLLENLTWVMHSPQFQSIIAGKSFVFTKVRVTPGFSETYAMYSTSEMSREEAEALDSRLGYQANNIRLEAERLSLIGEVPKLVFVRDLGDGLTMPTPEELQRILIAQRKRSVEEETDDGPSVRRNAAEEDDYYHLQFSHLRYLRPRTDVLRFNRAQVMKKIVKSIDLSRPAHRHGKHLDE